LRDALVGQIADNIAIVGHGGVGTLLMLVLAGEEISRKSDQPAGGGNSSPSIQRHGACCIAGRRLTS
jgi:broad specificity phosphatase PhoE